MSLLSRLLTRWTKHPKTFAAILVVVSMSIAITPDLIFFITGWATNTRTFVIVNLIVDIPATLTMALGLAVIVLSEVVTKHHQLHAHEPAPDDGTEEDENNQ